MTDLNIDTQFLTGDVGEEQQHVGYNPNADDALSKEIRVYATFPETPGSSAPEEKKMAWLPEPGTECEARAIKDAEWCRWKPVTVRGYFESDVWLQCGSACFTCPISAMEFRTTQELVPISKGGELNKASWNDFVSRLRHDCVGEGVQDHLTANAIFRVEERVFIYGLDLDYTEKVAICIDDDSYHGAQEYWESCDEEEREELNSKAQFEYGRNFCDLSGHELHSMLNERDSFTVTGWYERWQYVNSHFTKDAAEHFIATNSHNYRKGLRVYVDSQYRCPEYNTIKDAILSGKLQFVEGEQA